MSQLDFQGQGDNRIAVWALTNTASLDTASPDVRLQNQVITTRNAGDTYQSPAYGVDQKSGPHPLGDQCGCPEEQIAANDDRMNKPMFTNGVIWAGLNTELPPADASGSGQAADKRAGIMYFAVRPSLSAGKLDATMVRDGYVQVAGENVIFPSIAASPRGPVAMFFTLSGSDDFPSAAWARLDGLAPGQAPPVHISGAGVAPEDGFTGYPEGNQFGVPLDTPDGSGVARWGDYTYAAVDENGCLWGAAEFIPNEARDANAGNWGTYITRVVPTGCSEPPIVTRLNVNACTPAFTDPGGDDSELGGDVKQVSPDGSDPQLDIVAGTMSVSNDHKTVTATLTLRDLSTTVPPGGEQNDYFMYWDFDGVSYTAHAAVSALDGSVTYEDRENGIPRTTGPADTGTFTPGPNGTVSVVMPASEVGGPRLGDLLLGPHAETRVRMDPTGTTDFLYDTAGPTYDVLVGGRCLSHSGVFSNVSAGLTQHGVASRTGNGPAIALPNTGADDRAVGAASAAGVALLLGVRAASRRRRRRPSAA
jgi:hypothetical protein